MQEKGIVIETAGARWAQVRIDRTEACEGCHGCLYQADGHFMVADVVDRVGAEPGDHVRMETMGPSPVSASLLVFGVPLALLFAGYVAGGARAGGGSAAGVAGHRHRGSRDHVRGVVRRAVAREPWLAQSAGQSVIVEVLDRKAAAT